MKARTKLLMESVGLAVVEDVVTVWDLTFNSHAAIFPWAVHRRRKKISPPLALYTRYHCKGSL